MDLQAKRVKLVERLRWHQRLIDESAAVGITATKSLRAAERRRAEIAALDRALEGRNEMTEALTPPHEGWRLQAISTFRAGAVQISRGSFLSDAETEQLARSKNSDALLGSYLKWALPPIGWKPKPRTAAVPLASKPIAWPEVPSWVGELASRASPNSWCWQLAVAMLTTGKPFSVAIDQVPRDLVGHATKEFADMRKPNSGLGTPWRSVAHLNDYLMAIIARLQKQREAA